MNADNGSEISKKAETPLPNSKKIYVAGNLHPDIRVPFREISLAPTKSMDGHVEGSAGAAPVILHNEPVRVYDTSGPWGDPDFHGDVTQGLQPLRAKWIRDRGDVEEIDGRKVRAIDDGYLSEKHAAVAAQRSTPNAQRPTFNGAGAPSRRRPLRASVGQSVTQLAYARRGIITPEMEFIAIRENGGQAASLTRLAGCQPAESNDLRHQHRGESFGATIPNEITPEFVR
ncbi:MAG: hypothetical protein WAN04_06055, partial [Candidatus Udaeobacter sp.]